jgi:hypothetical protein
MMRREIVGACCEMHVGLINVMCGKIQVIVTKVVHAAMAVP